MTSILTREDVQLSQGIDPSQVTHIIDQKRWSIADAVVFGTEIEALCGYRWVPTKTPNPDNVCNACKAVLDTLGKGYVP